MGSKSRGWAFTCVMQLSLVVAITALAAPNITSTSSLQPTATTSLPSSITSPASLTDNSWEGRCWSSWNSYNSAESSYNDQDHPWPGSSVYTINATKTIFNYTILEPAEEVPMTTFCDGFPRALRPRNTTTLSTYVTTYNGWYDIYPAPAIRTDVKPTCTLDDDSRSCTRFWSSWNSVSSVYLHQNDYDAVRHNDLFTPPCMQPDWPCPAAIAATATSTDSGERCTVRAAPSGTIFYWPVTTVSGDLCNRTGTTITPTPTEDGAPNTVEYADDLTFTSPSVYVIMDTASADWVEHTRFSSPTPGWRTAVQWTHPCGPTVTSITLTLDPTDLSTVQGSDGAPVWPKSLDVNWADFNKLNVRHDAYQYQCNDRRRRKYDHGCPWQDKIWDDYSPYFSTPHEVVGEVDEWEEWKCDTVGIWPLLRPRMVSIEPDMVTRDDGERRKGRLTVKPMGSPTLGVAGVTGTASARPPVSTGEGDDEDEGVGDGDNGTDSSV